MEQHNKVILVKDKNIDCNWDDEQAVEYVGTSCPQEAKHKEGALCPKI